MKRNLTTGLIALALVVVMVGATMAWFTDQAEATNTFEAGTVDIEVAGAVPILGSKFDNWNPGDESYIKYTFTNNGSKKLRFRVGFEGIWEDELPNANVGLIGKDGGYHILWYYVNYDDPIEMQGLMAAAAENTWDLNDDWTFHNGYLYYGGREGLLPNSGILEPGKSVELVLHVSLDGPTTGNLYQGKEFTLNGQVQAIQASHADEWDWDNVDFETGLEVAPQ